MWSARIARSLITSLPEMQAAICAQAEGWACTLGVGAPAGRGLVWHGVRGALRPSTAAKPWPWGRGDAPTTSPSSLRPTAHPAEAREVLRGKHGADDAVVAVGVPQPHLVLQHPPRRSHALRKWSVGGGGRGKRARRKPAPRRRSCPVATLGTQTAGPLRRAALACGKHRNTSVHRQHSGQFCSPHRPEQGQSPLQQRYLHGEGVRAALGQSCLRAPPAAWIAPP